MENIKRCSNGHWYDTSVYKVCPHCKLQSEKLGIRLNDVVEDDRTVSIAEAGLSLGQELGTIIGNAAGTSPVSPMFGGIPNGQDDDRTISFGFFGMTALPPVTGWLVCLTGSERGKDFRLHMGKNFVGRSTAMDVILVDDKKISRDKHCSIIYDPKGDSFYVAAEGGNLVYLNEELVHDSSRMEREDVITIGDTKLMFVPFYKGVRQWEKE